MRDPQVRRMLLPFWAVAALGLVLSVLPGGEHNWCPLGLAVLVDLYCFVVPCSS